MHVFAIVGLPCLKGDYSFWLDESKDSLHVGVWLNVLKDKTIIIS